MLNNNKLLVSKNGTIINPLLHDAYVVGIFTFDDTSSLWIVIATDDQVVCLSLFGVERFRCDDFRLGNIILDMTIEDVSAMSIKDVSLLYDINPDDKAAFQRIIDSARSKELVVVNLNSSYGCTFISTCSGAEIIDNFCSKLVSKLTIRR